MCGIPASGKTYYAKNILLSDKVHYVSRDEIRFSLLNDNEDYFSKEKEVYSLFIDEISKYLVDPNCEYVIADATHLNWPSRRKLLKSINLKLVADGTWKGIQDINIIPVVINTPYKIVLERNNVRTGREHVPTSVLADMKNKFEDPVADAFYYNYIIYDKGTYVTLS